MAHHHLERRIGEHPPVRPQEGGGEIQPHHAVAVGDGAKLVIRQVAGMRADRVYIGMGGDQRSRRQSGNIPETGLVDMGQVDQHAKLVATADKPFSGGSQARSGIGRGRIAERHPVAEDVGAAPDRSERAQPHSVEPVQHGKPGIDRLDAFEMHDRGDAAIRHGGPDVGDGPADSQRPGGVERGHDSGLCQRDRGGVRRVKLGRKRDIVAWLGHCGAPAVVIGLARRNPHGEEPAGESAAPRLAKVERRVIPAGEGRNRIIGMQGMKPGEGVIMPVEHRQAAGRRSCRHHPFP